MHGAADTLIANATFWEQAYLDNFDPLCSRASRQLTRGNVVDAQDTVSEAFVRAMRYAVKPEIIENTFSYLWTVVRRVWSTQKTSADVAVESLDGLNLETIDSLAAIRVEPEVLQVLEQEDNRQQLKLKLGPLTLAERQMVDFYLKGYSWSEMAQELGADVRQVQFNWYRFVARQRYRENKLRARKEVSLAS